MPYCCKLLTPVSNVTLSPLRIYYFRGLFHSGELDPYHWFGYFGMTVIFFRVSAVAVVFATATGYR